MPVIIDPAKRLEALLNKLEPRYRREFLETVANIKGAFTIQELVSQLESGGIVTAADGIVETQAGTFSTKVTAGFVLVGEATAEFISSSFDVRVGFDQVNTRAVQAMQNNQLRIVSGFTQAQRDATQSAIVDGITRGLNPRQQAVNFRDSIGLTETQLQAVSNYRRLLEIGSTDALDRQLRDRRFDSTVRRAIDTDEPLTKSQIDRMVNRYRERFLAFRAETIARTEALRSVHQGSQEAFLQGSEQGLYNLNELTRTWITAGDERVRGSHVNLSGLQRAFDETFPGADGELRFPGDPDAPASETVQCRCVLSTRIQT